MTHSSDHQPDRPQPGNGRASKRSAVPTPARKPRPKPAPVAILSIPTAPSAAPAFDARLDELARAAGTRRHGETPSPSDLAPRPLPDAALVMGLTLQFARLSGRVPAPLLDGLRRLSESGEPTSRMLLGWLRRQSEAGAQDHDGRTAR